ncbi:MAG: hypothetical protein ACE5MI_14770 [Acidimicrobiia bacterium]
MAKPRKTLKVPLPEYVTPPREWQRQIQERVLRKQEQRGVVYREKDKLELQVRLYLKGTALRLHDVDNRLKDVMDALQGRLGGPKRIKPRSPIMWNDSQVYRAVAEKRPPSKKSHGHGYLVLRKCRPK